MWKNLVEVSLLNLVSGCLGTQGWISDPLVHSLNLLGGSAFDLVIIYREKKDPLFTLPLCFSVKSELYTARNVMNRVYIKPFMFIIGEK